MNPSWHRRIFMPAVAIHPLIVANGSLFQALGEVALLNIKPDIKMENKTASNRTIGLLKLFDFQTGFFPRALAGIKEEDMYNRLNTQANHPAWLAGALVNQRFLMASETGTG